MSRRGNTSRTASIVSKENNPVAGLPSFTTRIASAVSQTLNPFQWRGDDSDAPSAGPAYAGSSSARTQGALMAAPFGRLRTPRYAVSAVVGLVLVVAGAAPTIADAAPAWNLQSAQSPEYLPPEGNNAAIRAFRTGEPGSYTLTIKNTGDAATAGPIQDRKSVV